MAGYPRLTVRGVLFGGLLDNVGRKRHGQD